MGPLYKEKVTAGITRSIWRNLITMGLGAIISQVSLLLAAMLFYLSLGYLINTLKLRARIDKSILKGDFKRKKSGGYEVVTEDGLIIHVPSDYKNMHTKEDHEGNRESLLSVGIVYFDSQMHGTTKTASSKQ